MTPPSTHSAHSWLYTADQCRACVTVAPFVAVYPEGSVELRAGAELPPVEQEPISTRERSGAKATVRVVRAQKTMAAKGAAPVRGTHSKCGARFDVDWWSLLPWPLQCANARAQISYRVGKGHEAVFHSPPRGREGLRRLASVLKVEVPRRQK